MIDARVCLAILLALLVFAVAPRARGGEAPARPVPAELEKIRRAQEQQVQLPPEQKAPAPATPGSQVEPIYPGKPALENPALPPVQQQAPNTGAVTEPSAAKGVQRATGGESAAPPSTFEFGFWDWLAGLVGIVLFAVAIRAVWTQLRSLVRSVRESLVPGPGTDEAEAALKQASGSEASAPSESLGSQPGDVVVTDQAIQSPSQDRLGTRRLARALALFLQNRNTQPPVTLAVTGGWGSGKSSVMGMMRHDLEQARFATVWFNAWHYHDEEHLFGALIESIRHQALPPLWQPSGMWFRLRLLALRAARHPLGAVALAGTATYWVASGLGFSDVVDTVSAPFAHPLRSAFLASGLLLLGVGVDKGFTAFGLNVTGALRRMRARLRPFDFDADPGLRYRIKRALGDVTRALGRRPLVIFIDDLDRCPSERVLQVLETVNFLSTSPHRSFIVLGMDLEKVLLSIASEFAPIVAEGYKHRLDENEQQREVDLQLMRLAHAQNYLEKLVNIEIHVPSPDAQALRRLAAVSSDEAEAPTREQNVNRALRIVDRWVAPTAMAAALLVGVYLWSLAPVPTPDPGNAVGSAVRAGGIEFGMRSRTLLEGRWPYVGGGAIALAALAMLSTLASRGVAVRDAPDFRAALEIWSRAFAVQNPTPRHNKRITNQLRLQAMRARLREAGASAESSLRRAVGFVLLRGVQELGFEGIDVLSVLLALGGRGQTLSRAELELKLKETGAFATLPETSKGILIDALLEHAEKLPKGFPEAGDCALYRELIQDVVLH